MARTQTVRTRCLRRENEAITSDWEQPEARRSTPRPSKCVVTLKPIPNRSGSGIAELRTLVPEAFGQLESMHVAVDFNFNRVP